MGVLSASERDFIYKCICRKQKRLDGRCVSEGRSLEILFGQEWGCCIVIMGNTRVLSQVSAEVTEAKASTPSEGVLHVNLEFSPMAFPEAKSRTSDEAVESQRILERCIRDSKCVDLESLCILAGAKVWTVRVDVHAMNDDGNLLECASVAAIASLAHFKRPDVLVLGTEVTLRSLNDRDPVPLNIHHMPLSVNLALFEQGQHIVVDPTKMEERVADGCYMIGMNAHQEVSFIHRRGVLLLQEATIGKCEDAAVKRAQELTQAIRKSLDDDNYSRLTKASVGFVHLLKTTTILGAKYCPVKGVNLTEIIESRTVEDGEIIEVNDESEETTANKEELHTTTVQQSAAHVSAMGLLKDNLLFEGGASKWDIGDSSSDSESSNEEEKKIVRIKKELEEQDSSEEETVALKPDQVDAQSAPSRGWYTNDPFA